MEYSDITQTQIDEYRDSLTNDFKDDCLMHHSLVLLRSSNDIHYLDGVVHISNVLLEYRRYLINQTMLYPDVLKMVKESKSFDDLRTAHKKLDYKINNKQDD